MTHRMAEVLLPTGLTGRGLITGKSAWLLMRAPFWITPRGTERERERESSARENSCTHRSHATHTHTHKERGANFSRSWMRASAVPLREKRHKRGKAAANHRIANERRAGPRAEGGTAGRCSVGYFLLFFLPLFGVLSEQGCPLTAEHFGSKRTETVNQLSKHAGFL